MLSAMYLYLYVLMYCTCNVSVVSDSLFHRFVVSSLCGISACVELLILYLYKVLSSTIYCLCVTYVASDQFFEHFFFGIDEGYDFLFSRTLTT